MTRIMKNIKMWIFPLKKTEHHLCSIQLLCVLSFRDSAPCRVIADATPEPLLSAKPNEIKMTTIL